MVYYKLELSTPYCGTEDTLYYSFKDKPTDKELDEIGEEMCRDHAESYEHLVFGWDSDPVAYGEMTEDEYQAEIEDYYASCGYRWEEINREEYEENN